MGSKMQRFLFILLMIFTPISLLHAELLSVKVDHIKQEKNLCVPTSVAMVLGAFGEKRSPRELKVLSRGKNYNPAERFNDFTPTWFKDMLAGLRKIDKNWSDASFSNDDKGFENGLSTIEASLRRGTPVLVDTSGIYSDGHTLVVSGIDTNRKRIMMVDPFLSAPGKREMSYDEFKAKWNSTAVGWNGRGALIPRR